MEAWSLKGKVALVTGAGRNIGRSIALALAAEGAHVAVNARSNADEAASVCAEVTKLGVRAVPVIGDVSSEEDVARIFIEIHSSLGPVSVLVNNVALRPHRPFFDITAAEWDLVLGIGLRGSFLCAQNAAKDMRDSGAGRIINISGRDGFAGRTDRAHGVTVKAGIHGFTKALAMELGPLGITTNTVVPGLIQTTRRAEFYPNLNYDDRAKRIPVRRVGATQDIAEACAFLAKDAGYINGTTIHVNGGESLF